MGLQKGGSGVLLPELRKLLREQADGGFLSYPVNLTVELVRLSRYKGVSSSTPDDLLDWGIGYEEWDRLIDGLADGFNKVLPAEGLKAEVCKDTYPPGKNSCWKGIFITRK